ncbi:hypothetical protein CsSME_00036003 [Camellia sinensis var. sinensis]
MALKKWNVEVFGNVESNLRDAENELHAPDLTTEMRNLDEGEIKRRKEVKELVWKFRKRKEWLWLQKSRMEWTLKGDRNTRFFHITASKRQSRNMLDSLNINGTIFEEPMEVKQAICNHFQKQFTEPWKCRPSIGGSFMRIESNQVQGILEKEFTEAEVWAAIKECDGNKAPSPDGFNLTCFQKGRSS